MAQYTVEMAFDWDSVIEAGQVNRLLENTPQKNTPEGWGPGNYAELKVGDQIEFPVWDNSATTDQTKTVTGFTMHIVDAETGDEAQPFSSPLPRPGRLNDVMAPGTSATYGNCRVAWPLGTSNHTLNQAGRYLVTMTLEVQYGGETRTFSVDPEWIVGGKSGG